MTKKSTRLLISFFVFIFVSFYIILVNNDLKNYTNKITKVETIEEKPSIKTTNTNKYLSCLKEKNQIICKFKIENNKELNIYTFKWHSEFDFDLRIKHFEVNNREDLLIDKRFFPKREGKWKIFILKNNIIISEKEFNTKEL